jgi:hypothetical protein
MGTESIATIGKPPFDNPTIQAAKQATIKAELPISITIQPGR